MVYEDIFREILYRSSLQDLYKCKVLSKECKSMISDPDFEREKQRVIGDSAMLIIAFKREFEVCTIRSGAVQEAFVKRLELPWPLSSKDFLDKKPVIIGSYNGLIGVKYDAKEYMLWNPVTDADLIFGGRNSLFVTDPTAFGFCYNRYGDEYMAVVIGNLGRVRFSYLNELRIEIVNFSINESKTVDVCPNDILFQLHGARVVVSGMPHWVKENHNMNDLWERKRVVYFDPKNETFSTIKLPIDERVDKRVLGLGSLEGQQTLGVVFQDKKNLGSDYDVWIMKEYGNMESWIFMCKIPSFHIRSPSEFVNVVGIKPGKVWAHHTVSHAETDKLKHITL